ncbi:MAG: Polysaccharide pyruvyl transferase family protein WcaK [Microbacteriaceae bacterium]|nr:Polysaccharide pyruvyl transferase family protein WcaK [Microbacteriaceae bacterium]
MRRPGGAWIVPCRSAWGGDAVDIFVPGRGQYENIGDVLLRRHLLDWLRPCGRLHVYVGRSPQGFDEGLGLQPGDVRYRSFMRWYLAGLASAARGRASYVFKPGEIQLTLIGMKEHLSMLPLVALIRARGGAVARVGAGSRSFAGLPGLPGLLRPRGLPRMLIRPSIALSNLSLWRDAETARYLGGGVVPDLGFGEGTPAPAQRDYGFTRPGFTRPGFMHRDVLVVSMRSDLGERPDPPLEWLEAIKLVAERQGLEIWTVTQVHVDDERSQRLASVLGARTLPWDGLGHDQQEARLRSLYQRAALVVSDRLHVLIAAFTEGAVPAGLVLDSSDKIARHFAAAGIHDVSFPSAELRTAELVSRLENLLGRRRMLLEQLERARVELEAAGAQLALVLRGAEAPVTAASAGAVYAHEGSGA